MKKIALLLPILMLSGSMLFAQGIRINLDIINGKRQPNPQEMNAMRAEENAHPNIAKAMHDTEKSLEALRRAPDDFGGYKAQAITDLQQALFSLRKALYYRLMEDRR